MDQHNSLVNLGELSRPATVLIERISDALGGYFRPYQIRRVAAAEADAEKIKALAQIEITDLQRRALQRFIAEEAKKQDNIESITSKALPGLQEGASPQNVEDDWITNFFDKCRLISDDEMQGLWARVLAGEANAPGTYSKRTVSYLASLDKEDAKSFTALCGFGWLIGEVVPIVFDAQAPVYNQQGINFGALKHLDDIGLISFEALGGFKRAHIPKRARIHYYGTPLLVEFPMEAENTLAIGHAVLTKVGKELAPISGAQPVAGFLQYVVEKWVSDGLPCSSPYPRAQEGAPPAA
jgi:hypothetical protein